MIQATTCTCDTWLSELDNITSNTDGDLCKYCILLEIELDQAFEDVIKEDEPTK